MDENNSLLPYEDMLLYMAAVPNPLHGLYRALAIAEREAMPTLKEQLPNILMNAGSLNTVEYERLVEKEHEQADQGQTKIPYDGFVSVEALYQVKKIRFNENNSSIIFI